MLTVRRPLLCLLLTSACTSLEPPLARGPVGARDDAAPDPVDHDDGGTTDPVAKPEVLVAVGSVRLEQDCPDPPEAEAKPSSELKRSAVESAKSERAAEGDMSEREFQRRAGCDQSTLQLTLDNTGARAAHLRIASISLRDLPSDGIVAPIRARGPEAWGPDGAYLPWNEDIAAGTKMQVSYRLTPPDWANVDAKIGGGGSENHDFALEVTVEIDGKPMTVRSPTFRRVVERMEMIET